MTILAMLVFSACTMGSSCPAPQQTAPAPMLEARCSGCACRGGPGYRDKNGKCVGWKALKAKCGNPPEARCTDERDGRRRGNINLPNISDKTASNSAYSQSGISYYTYNVYEYYQNWNSPFHKWHW